MKETISYIVKEQTNNISHITESYEGWALVKNNSISFVMENIVMNITYDDNKVVVMRTGIDNSKLEFNKNSDSIYIKETEYGSLNFKLLVDSFKVSNNLIEISYYPESSKDSLYTFRILH